MEHHLIIMEVGRTCLGQYYYALTLVERLCCPPFAGSNCIHTIGKQNFRVPTIIVHHRDVYNTVPISEVPLSEV